MKKIIVVALVVFIVLSISIADGASPVVKGGILLPASYTTGTLPTCDANIPGGIVWDSSVSKLKYCDGVSAWVAL